MSSIGFGPLGCSGRVSACFNLRSQVILEGSPLGFKSPNFLLKINEKINLQKLEKVLNISDHKQNTMNYGVY